jgi:hypothetical protein
MKSIHAVQQTVMVVLATLTLSYFTPPAAAQGTLYVSTLGETLTSSLAVGSDSWLAQPFDTGTNAAGYALNSVQLLMSAATGNPSGFSVLIYNQTTSSPYSPMNSVGSLGGSLNPSASGLYSYTASGILLSPHTLYYLVVTATMSVAQGAYNWRDASDLAEGSDQWIIEPGYSSSSDGLSWQYLRPNTFSMAIYATAIPEPSAVSLISLGCGILFYVRRRK